MKAEVWNFSQFNTSKLFFFIIHLFEVSSCNFHLMHETRTPKHFLRIGTQGAFEAEVFVRSSSYPSKDLFLNRSWVEGESLLCLAGQWQPGTDTQAADSTQIPSVRRFHLDLAETSVVFSWDIPSFLTVLPLSQGPLAAGFPVSQQWRWLSCLKGVGCSLLSTVVQNCLVGICIKGQTLRKLPSRPQ